MAQTAVLGDSQGSVAAQTPTARSPGRISPADLAADGGVGSELGESYVDGGDAKRVNPQAYADQDDEDDENLADGGVLGLLAQIYETKGQGQGPARVI